MKNKTANWMLLIFDLFAIGGLSYLFFEHFSVMSKIDKRIYTIEVDTGVYCLILLSIFPLLRIIQLYLLVTKKKHYHNTLNIFFIFYFIFCLSFAYLCPGYVTSRLVNAGYQYHSQDQLHRVSRGTTKLFKLQGDSLNN